MKKKKVLVTVTNYSKYCGEGKKILEDGGCEMIENRKGRPLEYSGAAEPPVRCSPSQSTDGIDPLLFCLVKDGRMWQRLSRLP